MQFSNQDINSVGLCVLMAMTVSFVTVLVSAVCGATFAYYARPNLLYGAALAALFLPFAVGESVWAYITTLIAASSGFQLHLLSASGYERGAVLFLCCLGRTVPLATFFCAIGLHRYSLDVREYFQTHKLSLSFFLSCAVARLPRSTAFLLGLLGGALAVSESSMPLFLYRANPGTGPELLNLMLARRFREIYALAGSTAIDRLATFGIGAALVEVVAALAGAWAGYHLVQRARPFFFGFAVSAARPITPSAVAKSLSAIMMLPGFVTLFGLAMPWRSVLSSESLVETILGYREIFIVGIIVGCSVTFFAFAAAVALRYARRDYLAFMEKSAWASVALMLPAFIPTLSVIAAMGTLFVNTRTTAQGVLSLYISQVIIHFPVFMFVAANLVASIPDRRVTWQRVMKVVYIFSLLTDGFKRHQATVTCLVGLGLLQVVSDGAISRWFANVIKAPEESLTSALFGRLSDSTTAYILVHAIGIGGIAICLILAFSFLHELRSNRQDA